MDAHRFDILTRSLTDARSRRGALAALLGGTLGLLGLADTGAKKRKKKGKKGKKKKGRNPPPAATATTPTCTDGIKNGSETGVDCGGSCVRCANGQGCATKNDCVGAFCSGATCQACSGIGTVCGSDVFPACYCQQPTTGPQVCSSNRSRTALSCTNCSADETCHDSGGGTFNCIKRCGAP